jgi:PIN domain nuclease of toxin-antitoxin system
LGLLIDTQSIVWLVSDASRLSVAARAALTDGNERLFVSVVTAFEYTDLNRRGRYAADLPLGPVLAELEASVLEFPAEAWLLAEALPTLHLDPVDRMLIAHAIHADLTLITADKTIRKYPVRTLW